MPKVNIKGNIISNNMKEIYAWYGIEATCPNDVSDIIKDAKNEKLEVEINSGGGDIFAGSEIYGALKAYKGEVEITVIGLAASAASVISMGGTCKMVPTALMMVHNVSTYAEGDYNEMEKASNMLKTANQSIANAYIAKTGMSADEALEMMNTTTWMTAQQAKEKGLIDEILYMDEKELSFTNGFDTMLSKEKIEAAKNEIKKATEAKERKELEDLENKELETIKNQLLEDLDLI